jgi:hypothetical protein
MLGVVELPSDAHDLPLRYLGVPRVPVPFNCNDQGDLFGAACSMRYHQSVKYYLDIGCLAMTGPLLAGWLIGD